MPKKPDILLEDLAELVVDLDERIGIMHFDGLLELPEAEREAVESLVRAGRLWGVSAWADELQRRSWLITDGNRAHLFERAAGVLRRAARVKA